MHDHERPDPGRIPAGPFGYRACDGCGVAVQRRVAGSHECDPERYAAHQSARLHWRVAGFDDAVRRWLETPAGRFAEYCARRAVPPRATRPGEA
jgi:hypothetical protein